MSHREEHAVVDEWSGKTGPEHKECGVNILRGMTPSTESRQADRQKLVPRLLGRPKHGA